LNNLEKNKENFFNEYNISEAKYRNILDIYDEDEARNINDYSAFKNIKNILSLHHKNYWFKVKKKFEEKQKVNNQSIKEIFHYKNISIIDYIYGLYSNENTKIEIGNLQGLKIFNILSYFKNLNEAKINIIEFHSISEDEYFQLLKIFTPKKNLLPDLDEITIKEIKDINEILKYHHEAFFKKKSSDLNFIKQTQPINNNKNYSWIAPIGLITLLGAAAVSSYFIYKKKKQNKLKNQTKNKFNDKNKIINNYFNNATAAA
jgi:hypothetical protein